VSIKAGLGWTLKRRSRFLNQVDMFNKVVDSLYGLVPPNQILKMAGAEGNIGESVLASWYYYRTEIGKHTKPFYTMKIPATPRNI